MRRIAYQWDKPDLARLLLMREEEEQRKAISLLVKPGDTVVDVGAHIGRFSFLASQLVKANGHVYSFEATPETCWHLRENMVLNRCQNVHVENTAVCEKNGTVKLNLFPNGYSSWNSLGFYSMPCKEDLRIAPSASVDVCGCTLDSICSRLQIGRVNFLKVDVEGFEKHVFLGARDLLRNRRVDCICFEISQEPLAGVGIAAREVFDVLGELGYGAYRYEPETESFRGPVTDSTEYWANYFASFRDLSCAHC